MNKQKNSAQRSGRTNTRQNRRVVFLPEQVELELVGIIGPADSRRGSGASESVIVDGEASLAALVESLRGAMFAVTPRGLSCRARGAAGRIPAGTGSGPCRPGSAAASALEGEPARIIDELWATALADEAAGGRAVH